MAAHTCNPSTPMAKTEGVQPKAALECQNKVREAGVRRKGWDEVEKGDKEVPGGSPVMRARPSKGRVWPSRRSGPHSHPDHGHKDALVSYQASEELGRHAPNELHFICPLVSFRNVLTSHFF